MYLPRGVEGDSQQRFVRGRSAPSFKPLLFYIQQLSKKYPLHVARMKRR